MARVRELGECVGWTYTEAMAPEQGRRRETRKARRPPTQGPTCTDEWQRLEIRAEDDEAKTSSISRLSGDDGL